MTDWTAIVPVKAWSAAKSRLGVPGEMRAELARALTLDTLDLLAAHPSIARLVVVTADDDVAREARLRGATVLAEEPDADPLNDAIRQGLAWIAEHGDGKTVVVPADLAYLSDEVLGTTLSVLAHAGAAHVPDLDGTGTTLLAASAASRVEPHYGVGSSALHAAAGFPCFDDVDPRVRADIDQVSDLVGEWTPGQRVSVLLDDLDSAVHLVGHGNGQ